MGVFKNEVKGENQMKTIEERRKEFIKVLKLNGIEPKIDPESGEFDDHLSMTLWRLFERRLKQERKTAIEEVEELIGENEGGENDWSMARDQMRDEFHQKLSPLKNSKEKR